MDINTFIEKVSYIAKDYPSLDELNEILTLKQVLEHKHDSTRDTLTKNNIKRLIEEYSAFINGGTDLYQVYSPIKISFEQNKTSAFLTLIPPTNKGKMPDLVDAYRAIERSGVLPKLVDKTIVQKAFKKYKDSREIIWRIPIAQGRRPLKGRNSSMEFFTLYVDRNQIEKIYLTESVENLNYTARIRKNTLICEFKHPTQGEPGYTVTGSQIAPIPGEFNRFNCGENIFVSPDGKRYTAMDDGQIVVTDNTLELVPVKIFNGDMRHHSNFMYEGNVVVTGSIVNCDSLEITRDLVVFGDIIESSMNVHGNVIIGKDILGRNKSFIRTGGKIFARLISDCVIECSETVIVLDAISYSEITAGGKILALVNKGEIVGGSIRALKCIEARIIGSEIGTPTEIKIGRDFLKDNLTKSLEHELSEHKRNLIRIQEIKKQLAGKNFSFRRLDSNLQDMYLEILKSEGESNKNIKNISSKLMELKRDINIFEHGYIGVIEHLYPGTAIELGEQQKTIETQQTGVSFSIHPHNKEIVIKPLGALDYDFS